MEALLYGSFLIIFWFAGIVPANACACPASTKVVTASNCKPISMASCSLTVWAHIPTSVPGCRSTSTIMNTVSCPTATADCTVWNARFISAPKECSTNANLATSPAQTATSLNTNSPTQATQTTTPLTLPTSSKTTSYLPVSSTGSSVCIAGVGDGNYAGLCSFSCRFGYCPPGPCKCTAYGQQSIPPADTWPVGYPLLGLDDSYLGLCSYACNHGYCPPQACTITPPLTSPVCVAGVGPGNYEGLCRFSCNYGYCPLGPCTCTQYGKQVKPPPPTLADGYPLPGLDASYLGLCSYSCNHGYCPSTACTIVPSDNR